MDEKKLQSEGRKLGAKESKTMLRLPHVSPCSSPHHLRRQITSTSLLFSNNSMKQTRFSDNRKSSERWLCRGRAISYRMDEEDDQDEEGGSSHDSASDGLWRFDEAVRLFNEREYYACHDLLESLWYEANDPLRTLLHALLQCAVAFHHLFNQNHKGAMIEMGECICKLRKLNFEGGPFYHFEQEISAVLNFIYQTQLELAACNEDFCITMEQTERSYQLLEGFGAGQQLYFIDQGIHDKSDKDKITCIIFYPQSSYGGIGIPSTRIKLPILQASLTDIKAYESF